MDAEKIKKEDVLIDVFTDEAGYEFFRVVCAKNSDRSPLPDGGYFTQEDDLESWLEDEDEQKYYRIIKDYRK